MMSDVKPYLIAAILFGTGITALRAQDVHEILDKHQKAMGGVNNWEKIKSLKVKGEDNRGIRMQFIIDPGKAIKIDLDFAGTINHQAAVAVNDRWVRFLTWPHGTDSISMDAMNVYWPLFDFQTSLLLNGTDKGIKAEYLGVDGINNLACYKIKCTNANGHESIFFIDKQSYYLIRTESMLTIKDEDRDAFVIYSDYQSINGVMIPMSIITSTSQMALQKVDMNIPVTQAAFQPMPSETN